VGETGVARPAGKLRDVIRSQARSIRQLRRRENDPTKRKLYELRSKTESSPNFQAEASNALVSSPTFHLEPGAAFAFLPRDPWANTLDPFGTLCIPEDVGNTHFLLRHCE
jgi:hypothetical protein